MTSKQAEHLRKVAGGLIERFEYDSAIFILEKLIRLSKDDPEYCDDIERLCFCFYELCEYHRVISIFKSKPQVHTHLGCACLLIKSYLKIKKYKEGISFATELLANSFSGEDSKNENKYWKTAVQNLLSQHYLAQDNQVSGIDTLKQALRDNYLCFEIFFSLVDRHLISIAEQRSLVNELLAVSKKRNAESEQDKFLRSFMRFFFYITLSKHTRPDQLTIYPPFEAFNDNPDVLIAVAERHYYNCDYLTAYETIEELFQNDAFNMRAVLVKVSCLIEEKRSNDLCVLGQYMINLYPKSEISWYILGAYYHLLNKPASARTFLQKATMLNAHFAPAWLLCGHSFSQVQEHDQAISAFLRAAHYLPACHLPHLYVGIEYILTESYKLAERYVSRALELAPEDPFTLHELGIIAFHTNETVTAEKHFQSALKSVMFSPEAEKRISLRYLSLFNNLGHALRRLWKFDESVEMHKKTLSLSPNYLHAHMALGFVYAYKSEWTLAIRHLDQMFEQTIAGKEMHTLTENLLDNHVLKNFSDNELSGDETCEEPFTDKELVERLTNQAPIDVFKSHQKSLRKRASSSLIES